jgi:hypothetical protein
MDPFKRATLITAQAAMQQITSDEVRTEMTPLIEQMKADPESQPVEAEKVADREQPTRTEPRY